MERVKYAFTTPIFLSRARTITSPLHTHLPPCYHAARMSLDDTEPPIIPSTNTDLLDASQSAIQSVDDVNEIISLASQFDLSDFKVSDHGIEVSITRAGGRGFDADGRLADVNTDVIQQVETDQSPMLQSVDTENMETVEETEEKTNLDDDEVKDLDPEMVYDSDFVVTSNRVGFYFCGAKNKPPLVNLGDKVAFNQPVCIIEQLGQQYVYLSEASGTVSKVFVEDGDAVEFGQQIMVIRPD